MDVIGTVDGLVRRAAERAPDRIALRCDRRAVSYAALDASVRRFAALLRGARTVGLVAALHPAFPVAYYGIARVGARCVVLPPDPDEADLTGFRVLVATGELADRLRRVAAGSPYPLEVFYLDRPGESGTRAVPIATAAAGPQGDVVILNHLPYFDVRLLNSAVHSGATQLLCRSGDPGEAVALGRRYGATHYCSLPARLTRLAHDPRLGACALPAIRSIHASGRLAPRAARRLTDHFGVTVQEHISLTRREGP